MRDDTRSRVLDAVASAEERRTCLIPESVAQRRHLRELLAEGVVTEPERGAYITTACWDALSKPGRDLVLMRTLCAMHPTWVFCGTSAALAYGLDVSNRCLGTLHVCVVGDRHVRWPAGRLGTRRARWHPMRHDTPSTIADIRVTSPVRTVADCLRTLELPYGLAIADSYLRTMGSTSKRLVEDISNLRHLPGIGQALRTASVASPLSESGGESIARGTMLSLGFAEPELQVEFPDPVDRGRRFRVDFFWRLDGSRGIIGELSEREKYVSPGMTGGRGAVDVLADERIRESRLTASGYPIVRFPFETVTDLRTFARLLESFGVPHAEGGPDYAADLRRPYPPRNPRPDGGRRPVDAGPRHP